VIADSDHKSNIVISKKSWEGEFVEVEILKKRWMCIGISFNNIHQLLCHKKHKGFGIKPNDAYYKSLNHNAE